MDELKTIRMSVVIPAYNEASAIIETIASVNAVLNRVHIEHEVIVVDDGSSDQSGQLAKNAKAIVAQHPENLGYGAALKTGILHAHYEWIAILDADGSYPVEELTALLEYIPAFDMVVGARTGKYYQGGLFKQPSRKMFQWLSEFVTGRRIPDINSGMRIFRRDIVLRHFPQISSGFSFTTTLTLAMMLEGHFVKYVPISYRERIGKSHVRYLRDTLRSTQIIVQAILYYNPIKFFLLLMIAALLSSVIAINFLTVTSLPPFALLFGWGGINLMFVFLGMGGLAYAIKSRQSN